MKRDQASRTAQYMALFRALETARPEGKRLFSDPYAIYFLGKSLKAVSRLYRLGFGRPLVDAFLQNRIPGALSSGLARTKYIDDLLCQTVKNGIRQVIVLGAGFDTRSLRLEFLQSVRVIEIDHPDTARLKLEGLRRRGSLPANTSYLQLDFNTMELYELLCRHQVDFSVPTSILWEGVTNYLEPGAIDKTFTLLQRFAKGSFLLFTYVDRQVLTHPGGFYKAEKLRDDLEKIEERWTFGFTPADLPAYLGGYDYTLIEDLDAAGYRDRYIPDRKRISRGYEFYHVAFAEKK